MIMAVAMTMLMTAFMIVFLIRIERMTMHERNIKPAVTIRSRTRYGVV
jgi:hypothetical protein